MLNVRAETIQELDELLQGASDVVVPSLVSVTQELAALSNIQGFFPDTKVIPSGQVAAQSQAGASGKTCPHGPMIYRTGNAGTPNEWAGYFCSLQKGDPNKCRPQYVGK